MKWNCNNIIVFLDIYQKYPILWNIKDNNYCNTKLKEEIFQQLYCDLNEKQLIGEMNIKQLKAKIKSIKDVFRQEVQKIEKSKKSGSGTEDVYVPKLVWFQQASFLSEVMATRISTSNLVSKIYLFQYAFINNVVFIQNKSRCYSNFLPLPRQSILFIKVCNVLSSDILSSTCVIITA